MIMIIMGPTFGMLYVYLTTALFLLKAVFPIER